MGKKQETSKLIRCGFVYRDALSVGGYPRDIRWLASAVASYGVSVTLFTGTGTVTEKLTDSVRIEPLKNVGCSEVDLYHFFGLYTRPAVAASEGALWKLPQKIIIINYLKVVFMASQYLLGGKTNDREDIQASTKRRF